MPGRRPPAGGEAPRRRLASLQPGLVVLLGRQVYRAFAGLPRGAAAAWGLQPRQTLAGLPEFLAPNRSARGTVPYAARLTQFRTIADLAGPRP